eukprot:gnl/MRDRNA2_/MRDRNA2_85795_c0_seq1.p1 gnl/MRDRNA2_/MRDRNA2_85795_c0~~gnl/MRDRNA2_/MRDRNA2_85795_c0_seq1.p1  ORF type:complete len:535 (+),score=14.00 gnl/MRDRNA2_/MRDRNA2_85795_c0_seq1:907-2511(+)
MTIFFDDFGNPLVIIKKKSEKTLNANNQTLKDYIAASNSISSIMQTSFGPHGMDKLIQDGDGKITITNDGATILKKIEITNEIGKILAQLSISQDKEIGDGTTGVTILASSLLEASESIIDMGVHPLRLTEGFDLGCFTAGKTFEKISASFDFTDSQIEPLVRTCMTTLSPKIVTNCKRPLAEICVRAILAIADIKRREINLDLIKVECKTGAKLEDITLVNGIIIDKPFSHSQMKKRIRDAKIAILTCAFEPPRPKTKHRIHVKSASDYEALHNIEQNYFVHMVQKSKILGVNIVFCQWGFDDEANHLLMHHGVCAVRWVGGIEIELIAMATGAKITPRFQELSYDKIGSAKHVREIGFGTNQDKVIFIEGCPYLRAVTLLIRGGSKTVVDEVSRSIHDALCVTRNLLKSNKIVYGGGAAELSASLEISRLADRTPGVDQYTLRAYSHALEQIPSILAANSGMNPIEEVTVLRARQLLEKNPYLGVDCDGRTVGDMRVKNVFETLIGKKHQLYLATQACRMILKIKSNGAQNL